MKVVHIANTTQHYSSIRYKSYEEVVANEQCYSHLLVVVVVLLIVEPAILYGSLLALANWVRPPVNWHAATRRGAITCNKQHALICILALGKHPVNNATICCIPTINFNRINFRPYPLSSDTSRLAINDISHE
jgi:hypothetical protein